MKDQQRSQQQQQQWIIKIKNELITSNNVSDTSATNWSKRSIYRVPACVTDLNKRAYKPHVVSFGPYHHGEYNLRAMEEHKRRALLHFLKRSRNVPLETYVDALTPLVQDLKDAYEYDQLDPIKDDDVFLELMIMDGCFILEIMQTTTTTKTTSNSINDDDDYSTNDPIFSNHGKLHIVPFIMRDMLMLENQLPIAVLEILFAIQNQHNSLKQDNKLIKLILDFFYQESVENLQPFSECLHILDVYRKSLLLEEEPYQGKKKNISSSISVNHQGGDEIIRSATELIEAGIRIEKSKTISLKDISFNDGVLKLPPIVVDDALESLYLNLIAFERYHVGAGNEVTSYIFFMDNIIDNARDVILLHSCGIIQNALGSDKAVANLFNSMSKDITLDPESSLANVHNMVSAYCQESWHQWRANLMHTYFTNPWAIISVCAAIVLFALSFVQTVYSILSYFKESPTLITINSS